MAKYCALFLWTLCLMCPSDISFLPRPAMVWCERGIQVLLTTMGAFAAFALMTVAIGTDYWLYARAFICNSTANSTQEDSNNKDKKDPGALTHSGLWRICCLEGKAGCKAGCVCIHIYSKMCACSDALGVKCLCFFFPCTRGSCWGRYTRHSNQNRHK